MKKSSSKSILLSTIIVDPTVLNTRERLTALLESTICEKCVTVLPSSIFSAIQMEKWGELTSLLRRWEWNLNRAQSEQWFGSSDFKYLSRQLKEVCVSSDRVREELSAEDRELFSAVQKLIGHESPPLIQLAKELIAIAIAKRGGIFSYTRHLERWLKSLRRALILEISEKTDLFSRAKSEIKNSIHNAGYQGRIFVTFLNVITAVTLTSVLPTVFNWLIDVILTELGEEVIVGVITNGV